MECWIQAQCNTLTSCPVLDWTQVTESIYCGEMGLLCSSSSSPTGDRTCPSPSLSALPSSFIQEAHIPPSFLLEALTTSDPSSPLPSSAFICHPRISTLSYYKHNVACKPHARHAHNALIAGPLTVHALVVNVQGSATLMCGVSRGSRRGGELPCFSIERVDVRSQYERVSST